MGTFGGKEPKAETPRLQHIPFQFHVPECQSTLRRPIGRLADPLNLPAFGTLC